MAPIAWKPEFSVGIAAVDHEHQELVDLVNSTAAAILDGGPSETIERSFGDLLRGITAHFALEERFMREAGYDELAQHKAAHKALLDEIRDIMDNHAAVPEQSADRLVAALEAWFADHFKTHDARLHNRLGAHPHP